MNNIKLDYNAQHYCLFYQILRFLYIVVGFISSEKLY